MANPRPRGGATGPGAEWVAGNVPGGRRAAHCRRSRTLRMGSNNKPIFEPTPYHWNPYGEMKMGVPQPIY